MNDTEPKNDFSARIFLEDPLISAFYLAKEFRSYYESIRHTYTRRDYHQVAIDAFQKFLSIAITTNGFRILNEAIFADHHENRDRQLFSTPETSRIDGPASAYL